MRDSDLLHSFNFDVEDTNFSMLLNVFNCFFAKNIKLATLEKKLLAEQLKIRYLVPYMLPLKTAVSMNSPFSMPACMSSTVTK